MKRVLTVVLCLVLSLSILGGCSNKGGDSDAKEVKIGYVNWAEGIAMTNLVAVILEEKMDYKVTLNLADVAPVFTSVASGNTDIFLDCWLPVTHEDYMEEYGDKIDDLGISFENAFIGLVVPSYVDIDSIEQLNENKEQFGGQIIGIDAGAGIMKATETAITEYGLDFELLTGSGPTMTAALKKAIDANEPIVVTGWAPHWMFSKWDLKVLEDSEKIFGETESIHTITRKGLSEDMPEVTDFLKKFKLTDEELGDLMGAIEDDGNDPKEVAKTWMEENSELVDSWLDGE